VGYIGSFTLKSVPNIAKKKMGATNLFWLNLTTMILMWGLSYPPYINPSKIMA